MGEVARALGTGAELEYEGKTYRVSPWKNRLQAEFERWLERQAWAAVDRAKSDLSPADVKELRATVAADIAKGRYSFGADAAQEAMFNTPGFKQAMYLLISDNHPEVTPDLVGKMVDAKVEEALQALGESNADPTGPDPTPAVTKTP